jgi:hypothetical protein
LRTCNGEQLQFDELTIKHLEMIQSVISRLSTDSFLMKGWALTVTGAFYGFAVQNLNWRVATVGLLPVIAFWFLDAYFLSRERMYRVMYEAVRSGDRRIKPLSMDYRPFVGHWRYLPWRGDSASWWATFWSRTLLLLYGSLLVVGIALAVIAASH